MLNQALSPSAAETVAIPRRFNELPELGHGGYSAGTLAEHVDSATATVSLRRPGPLDPPLVVGRGSARQGVLLAGLEVVAHAEPAELELHVPEPVSVWEARAARGGDLWLDRHPSPTCFGCGVDRD